MQDAPENIKHRKVHPDAIGGKMAFEVHNVLSPAQAAALIELSESRGYEPAMINVGGGKQVLHTDVRNSSRRIIDDDALAKLLCQRLEPYIPTTWRGYHLVGLNERLRFLKYENGEYFKPHYDGCYVRGKEAGERRGEKSFLTLLLYLNEDYEGAFTRFLDEDEEKETLSVTPHTGMVLIHQHDILHESPTLVKGCKYVIRTDVMFSRTPPGDTNTATNTALASDFGDDLT